MITKKDIRKYLLSGLVLCGMGFLISAAFFGGYFLNTFFKYLYNNHMMIFGLLISLILFFVTWITHYKISDE